MSGEEILRTIEALRSGQPVSGALGSKVLSRNYGDAVREVSRAIDRARGLKPNGIREVYWIVGAAGNGKTQMLRQAIAQLAVQQGAAKYAWVYIDLDRHPAAKQREGLVTQIVRGAIASGQIVEVGDIVDRIIKRTPSEEDATEAIVFAVDVFSAIAQIPPSSLFIRAGLRRLFAFWRSTESHVNRLLAPNLPSNPEVLILTRTWIRYLLKPSTENSEEFQRVLTSLATSGELFDLFCRLLQSAGYTTILLVFDEVTELAVENFKPLWDPPEPARPKYKHDLNIVMLLSAKPEVWDKVVSNRALARRFCATVNGRAQLRGPRITGDDDDLTHAQRLLQTFVRDAPQFAASDTHASQSMDEVRQRLGAKGAELTWQDLWRNLVPTLIRI